MKSTHLASLVSAFLLMSAALTAQTVSNHDVVPLKPWPVPLYWQPTYVERQVAAMSTNSLLLSNAVSDATSSVNPLTFVAITPCRVVDTRSSQPFTGAFGPPSLLGSASRTFPIQSNTTCTIPSAAQAYSFNLSVVPASSVGFITAYPTGQTQPLAATLVWQPNVIVSNAAIVAAGTVGSIDIYANQPTDLVIDINGYYVPQSALTSVTVSQGSASAAALSFSGDPGTGIFSPGTGILNLDAGGTSGFSLDSSGNVTVAGNIHASGSISTGSAILNVDGNANSIMVDNSKPTVPAGNNPCCQIYLVGDDVDPPAQPVSQVQVGIATRYIPPDSKLRVFDPALPAVEVSGNVPLPGSPTATARGQFAVATTSGNYSNISNPGDVVLRADADKTMSPTAIATHDLILASRSLTTNAGGAMRFTTGTTTNEFERMTILQGGNVGVGTNTPSTTAPHALPAPEPVLDVNGQVRVEDLAPSPAASLVTATSLGVLGSIPLAPSTPNYVLFGNGTFGPVSSSNGLNNPCSLVNYIPKWNGSATVGCSGIDDLGTNSSLGNVGVHVGTAPLEALDVNGQTNSGINTTDTRRSYMIGRSPVLSINPGSSNDLWVGAGTGSGGTNNTMVGENAGSKNASTDSYNTCVGALACENANGSSGNSVFGYNAGVSIVAAGPLAPITGIGGSSFFGFKAGMNNTSGFNNTFLGYNAGMSNTSADGSTTFGQENTFVGYNSGANSKTSQGNTFVGSNSGVASGGVNPNDCCNTFVGKNSGLHSTASNNAFVGYRSGETTTSAGDDTYIGFRSGLSNVTGIYNTFLGSSTRQSTQGSSNIFVGVGAGANIANTSNNILIGHPGNVGDANTIRIGAQPSDGFFVNSQSQVFIDPILLNPTVFSPGAVSAVTIDTKGKLGFTAGGGGGGNVSTAISNCLSVSPINYLTKWTSATTVDCSHILESMGPSYTVGIGPKFFPPSAPFATRQLQVDGDIDINVTGTNHYQITGNTVLSIDGTNNLFAGVNAGPNSFGPNTVPPGEYNTFSGYMSGNGALGPTNYNTFLGAEAGQIYNATSTSTCQPFCGFNTSVGALASSSHMTGEGNVFLGYLAGRSFASGSNNTFLGEQTGNNTASGDFNIYIGQQAGSTSSSPVPESNTIRIGRPNIYTDAYVQGIFSSAPGQSANQEVCVDSAGKLWGTTGTCATSSRRFKEQIADMGDSSSKLFELRPVTFVYKPRYDDGSHLRQYGLIAEEVAKVYPDMVVYDKDGQPYTVKYQMLAPMLLNELQKQNTQLQNQAEAIQAQQEQNQRLEDRLTALEALLSAKAPAVGRR